MRNTFITPGWRKVCITSHKLVQESALAESTRHHTSMAMGRELLEERDLEKKLRDNHLRRVR